ncbi:MAG: hypothetical protein ACPGOV_09520 [Magnetovibrionaceae bacterium]
MPVATVSSQQGRYEVHRPDRGDPSLRTLFILCFCSISLLAAVIYWGGEKLQGKPWDFAGLFQEAIFGSTGDASRLPIAGIALGDTLPSIRGQLPGLLFQEDTSGRLSAQASLDGGKLAISFLEADHGPIVGRISFRATYLDFSETEVTRALQQRFGKPLATECGTNITIDTKGCTFSWVRDNGNRIEARLSSPRMKRKGREAPLNVVISLTDYREATLPVAMADLTSLNGEQERLPF